MLHSGFVPAILAGGVACIQAQQFRAPFRQSYDVMGPSDPCVKVLNTELKSCDPTLFVHTDRTLSTSVEVLGREELEKICRSECREELKELRVKIVETCTADDDVIRHDGEELPPFFFLDKFAYTYDINCYKDEAFDGFCDELRLQMNRGAVEVDMCHRCILGSFAAMISSPLGVSDRRVKMFKKLKADCEDTNYDPIIAESYRKPPADQLQVNMVPAKDTRVCARWYTVQEGDTCGDISRSQRVSTVDMIQKNAMDINCAAMPKVGTKLCLDKPCVTHTIAPGETCGSIARQYGITVPQFRSLNDMIDKCSNIARWEGYVVCVGPNSLFAGSFKAGNFPEFSSTYSQDIIPRTPRKPIAPGTSSKCNMFVNGRAATDPDFIAFWGGFDADVTSATVDFQNGCGYVAKLNGLAIEDFKKLNPSLKDGSLKDKGVGCRLKEEYSYCLSEEGGPELRLPEGWTRRRGLRWE